MLNMLMKWSYKILSTVIYYFIKMLLHSSHLKLLSFSANITC